MIVQHLTWTEDQSPFFLPLARLTLNPPMMAAWLAFLEAIDEPEYPTLTSRVIYNAPPRSVVLVSGGQDSTVAYRRAVQDGGEVLAVYVDFGESYQAAEMTALDRLNIPYTAVTMAISYRHRDPEWRHILPARNLLALQVAAKLGGEGARLWLGAVAGEIPATGGDKSKKFLELAGQVFNAQYGCDPKVYTLHEGTKADWAYWWRLTQPDQETLLKTVTCYHMADRHCGSCQACLRRYCALILAGYDKEAVLATYKVDPLVGASAAVDKYKKAFRQELLHPGSTRYDGRRAWQDLTVIEPDFFVHCVGSIGYGRFSFSAYGLPKGVAPHGMAAKAGS